jgi:hypothetical protein
VRYLIDLASGAFLVGVVVVCTPIIAALGWPGIVFDVVAWTAIIGMILFHPGGLNLLDR